MNLGKQNVEAGTTPTVSSSRLHEVTSVSKYLALFLFVTLPFIGGYVGYVYAPEKVVTETIEVESGDEIQSVSDIDIWLYSQREKDDLPFISLREQYLSEPLEVESEYFRFSSREFDSVATWVNFSPKKSNVDEKLNLSGKIEFSHIDLLGLWVPIFIPDEESADKLPVLPNAINSQQNSKFYVKSTVFLEALCEIVDCDDRFGGEQPYSFDVVLDVDELGYEVYGLGMARIGGANLFTSSFEILE